MRMHGINKYKNKRVIYNGHTFDSIKEANMYASLLILEKAKEIEDLVLQPKYILLESFEDANEKKHRPIVYYADFEFFDVKKRRVRIIDCKGMKTEVYKIKKKLFNNLYKHKRMWLEEDI